MQVFEIKVDDLVVTPILIQSLLYDYFQTVSYPIKEIIVKEKNSKEK